MKLVANDRLARNRVRLGTGLHLGAMAILASGVFVTTRQDIMLNYPWAEFATLLVGFGLFLLGQTQIRRFGPHTRQTEALGKAISDLDDRYRLYAFLSTSLPDYVLVGPGGIQVIEARSDAGKISCINDKWKREGKSRLLAVFDPPFGSPGNDARKGVERIKLFLDRADQSSVPVSAMVVFTDKQVSLKVENSSVPIARLPQMKELLRRWAGKGQTVALSTQRVRDLQTLFDSRMLSAPSWR